MEAPDVARDADVLVVGAGPVGTTVATMLAKDGVPTLVLEARGAQATRDTYLNLVPSTMDTLAATDAKRALAEVEPIVETRVLDELPGGEDYLRRRPVPHVQPDPSRAPAGVGALVAAYEGADPRAWGRVGIGDLENALRTQLAELPAARAVYDSKVLRIEQDAGGVTAIAQRADGTEQAYRGAVLVNAGGVRSIPGAGQTWRLDDEVNHFAGSRFRPTDDAATAYLRALGEDGKPHMTVALEHPDGTMLWAHLPREASSYTDAELRAMLNERARRLGLQGEAGEVTPLRFQIGRTEQVTHGRVLNVGDATRIPYFRSSTGGNGGIAVDAPAAAAAVRAALDAPDAAATLARLEPEARRTNDTLMDVMRRQMKKDLAGER